MKSRFFMLVQFAWFLSCADHSERIRPVKMPISESVYASCKIKAARQYDVYPSISGIVKDVLVTPGEIVNKGQSLFLLDNQSAILNTENSRLAYMISKANNLVNSHKLIELQLYVKQAKEKYLLDSALYSRQQNLWKENIGTILELEQRLLNFSTSKSNYQAASSKFSQMRIELKDNMELANLNYKISRQQQSDFIVKSAFNGKVFDVLKKKGESVNPQMPIAILGISNNFILEMQVDEYDIARVKPGQKVEVTMDSYKGRIFSAVVDEIHPIIDSRLRTFQVDAHFVNKPSILYPNLTAEGNIIISRKSSAVLIPREYLTAEKYVLLDGDKKHEVKTGLRDYQKVEILEGLDTNQYIYKPK